MLISAGFLASIADAAIDPPQRSARVQPADKVAKLPSRVEVENGVLVIFDIAAYADAASDIEGFLVYWDDYASEQLFLFGRLAEKPVDVGQAVLNLEIDLGIDSALLATQHWVLRKAVVDALRAQADAAEWAPATRGAVLDLLGCPVPEGVEVEPAIACALPPLPCFVTAPPDPDGGSDDKNDSGRIVDASPASPLRPFAEHRRCQALEASLNMACGCAGGGGGCGSGLIMCPTRCCNGVVCCGEWCCSSHAYCCENKRCCANDDTCCPSEEYPHCCPPEIPQCCGENCCKEDRECCDGVCCGAARYCASAGVCCPLDCDDDNVCTVDSCDTITGQCFNDPMAGLPCEDDGNSCTDDECSENGNCTHPCTGECTCAGSCCSNGQTCCNGTCCNNVCCAGTCCAVGKICSSGLCCSSGQTRCGDSCCSNECCNGVCCGAGDVCLAGGCCPPECDDGDVCTDDFCEGGDCTQVPNSAQCGDDGNECTDDICSGGTCTHPAANEGMTCPDDGNECTDDFCGGGACTHPANSNSCNDGDSCTLTDMCSTGVCSGTPKDCDDGDPCTSDLCDDGVCSNVNNSAPCDDDGNSCTNDICSDGVCTHPARDGASCTDDGDSCTDDICSGTECTHPCSAACDCLGTCCSSGQMCCNGVCCAATLCCQGETCCDAGQYCCDNGNCCSITCDGCVNNNGTLSGGTINVNPNRACVGDMITFTLSGVVDNGGQKRKNCVVVSDGPITPTYTWTMFLPANYPSPWPPLTGTGKIVNVEAKVPGSYRVTYIARANRTCPPPPRTIDSTTARAVSVRVANIDATDPHAAKINYFTHPGGALVDSVTFSAPGASGSLTNVVGDFFFTFDQSDLPTGASILQLDYTVGGSTCSPVHTTATRTWAKAPPQGNAVEVALFKISLEEGIFTIPVQHEIFGQFHFICYSANVVLGSKTLWVGLALVNIRTEESTEFPTEIAAWNESHLYSDTAGDHLEQIMPLVTGPTFPPQGPYFRSARLSFNTFFAPGNGLTSIARIDSLLFDTSNGPVLAIPIPLIGNTEIDLPLEANAAPVVDCP